MNLMEFNFTASVAKYKSTNNNITIMLNYMFKNNTQLSKNDFRCNK